MELRQRNISRDVDDIKASIRRNMLKDVKADWLIDKKSQYLGFRHWLLILTVISGIYGFVVYQDNRMPEVKPAGQYNEFSEERARLLLQSLTDLGPRTSGSENCEVHAFKLINDRLKNAEAEVEARGVNRLEIDVQRPSGCFNLGFLSSFTLCYHKITNIIARIGPKVPPKHSILLNCHFDTFPGSPGATDDAVSCAVMMEIMDILSHSKESLQNDIIFLFNGAEENFLQASHGFITQHPWRHSVRAFVNLEGSGAGGREILFQAGPGNSWLLHTYLENAPHPHCSVLAQEIFQAGIIPSDTDFRVFRDFGRISGLDIAYFRNGWVYHTEFDTPKYITPGCIQRAGENLLAVAKALVKSPYLDQPGDFEQGNRWVFYDVVGIFTVFYSIIVGQIFNYATAGAVLVVIAYRIRKGFYNLMDLFKAVLGHIIAAAVMLATGASIVLAVTKLDMIMCWYSLPELAFPLYIFPLLIAGCATHTILAQLHKRPNQEMVHLDGVLLLFSTWLALATFAGIAGASFLLYNSFFLLLRDPLLWLLGRMRIITRISPEWLLFTQLLCTIPVMVFDAYSAMLLFDFFVPVTGRMGVVVNPELIIVLMSLFVALCFVLFTSNLLYVSRRMDYLLKCGLMLYCLFFMALFTTRLGWPYKYSEESPRLRRLITLDTERSIYPFQSNISVQEHALFVQTLDYRGITDLPEHTFLTGNNEPNCTGIKDEYCRLPYYTAIHQLFPPRESRWIPLPGHPRIASPIKVNNVEKHLLSKSELRLSFTILGGVDKMSLHLTPMDDIEIDSWSFTKFQSDAFSKRNTYFVFLTYGAEAPKERNFWVVLKRRRTDFNDLDISKMPVLEISVATHYAHGPYQYSDTLTQLRSLIESRRKTPHLAIGWWRWAITTTAAVSEIVVHTF
uniref:FXNA-like protease n=1 Tax=Loa loa TaxID=7209 RepID=A0A1I7W4J7_LOALO